MEHEIPEQDIKTWDHRHLGKIYNQRNRFSSLEGNTEEKEKTLNAYILGHCKLVIVPRYHRY